MNYEFARFRENVKKVLRNEKVHLTSLMASFCDSLEKFRSTPYIFPLFKPYLEETRKLIEQYKKSKKSWKNILRIDRLRKETAKKFFNILERFGAIVPKWLSAVPDEMTPAKFCDWKAKTLKTEFEPVAKLIKTYYQASLFRRGLDKAAEDVAHISENTRLKELVLNLDEEGFEGDVENIEIGAPTKK